MSTQDCTEITPSCPLEATTYGYRPNLAANALFLAIFALCTLAQLGFALKSRIYAFPLVTASGCLLETLGYAGRLMLHDNPWSDAGFRLQIICIILAPSFLAAGIYLTIKHLVLHLAPRASRLPPRLYPWIFISCDIGSILLQAAGGGLAASGDGTGNLLDIGNAIIIAGIAFQVATMFTCWVLAVDFALRLRKTGVADESTKRPRFVAYFAATAVAFFTIFIRCVYRIPEMAGGWGSELQRNEPEFLVLDGTMIIIAAILMTVAHPAIFFPQISSRYVRRQKESEEPKV